MKKHFFRMLVFIITALCVLTPVVGQNTPVPGTDIDLLASFEDLALQENCQLPCWWGIKPGETTLAAVETLYLKSSFDRTWQRSIYGETIPLQTFIQTEGMVLFFQENAVMGNYGLFLGFDASNIVSSFQMTFIDPAEWLPAVYRVSFAELLQTFEATPEVAISRNSSLGDFRIYLTYPDQGIRVRYSFEVESYRQQDLPYLRLCLDLQHTGEIEIEVRRDGFDVLPPEAYGTPAEKFLIPDQVFVEFFRRNPDRCLRVRSNS